MPSKKLKQFLDDNGIRYVSVSHSPAYTAQQIAAAAHIPGKELAKTVIVKVDGEMAMAVMAAPHPIDFEELAHALGAKKVELASERDFADRFPECELGAMPPFGNLYDMKVYVDERLAEDETIAFNAGSHSELIKLDYADFERLAKPTTLRFTVGSHA